jgi:hypothetical protein
MPAEKELIRQTRDVKNTFAYLNDAANKARNIGYSTGVSCTETCTIKQGGGSDNQNESPNWLDNIEQGTLRWGEAKPNDNKRELLGCVVGELVEEHVQTEKNISSEYDRKMNGTCHT